MEAIKKREKSVATKTYKPGRREMLTSVILTFERTYLLHTHLKYLKYFKSPAGSDTYIFYAQKNALWSAPY
jgi:hypothetical protein